ncbi:MAG: RagB/SusD family nutrient uptake outer membrane protein, partial [Tannerella sp.]|nr:RagB/SusD family nutrient uptake outer membrane protein [Tannerella sp.]
MDDFTNSMLYPAGGLNGGSPNHYEKIRDITRMTEVINVLQNAENLQDAKKKNFTGEARLLRGLVMYYLLHIYGPVPVIIDPALVGNVEAEQNLVRPTLEQMAQWIYDDFDYAQQNMSNTAPNGRYTADYAKVCLMRHCLNEGSYMA